MALWSTSLDEHPATGIPEGHSPPEQERATDGPERDFLYYFAIAYTVGTAIALICLIIGTTINGPSP